ANFWMPQKKTLHERAPFFGLSSCLHAAMGFVDDHVEPIGDRTGRVAKSGPNGLLPTIPDPGQELVVAQFLGVDEVDVSWSQPFGIEGRINSYDFEPVYPVRLALNLPTGLVVELRHIGHPEDNSI